MYSHEFNAIYNIGDRVYHATPDGDLGIVLDISFSVVNNNVLYKVSYGRSDSDEVWCTSVELSTNKTF
jgi:uncharacterized protein (UPF0303 family)